MRVASTVQDMAKRKGATPGQVALAWLLSRGEDVVPIPGTKRRKYLEENVAAADVVLTAGDLAPSSQDGRRTTVRSSLAQFEDHTGSASTASPIAGEALGGTI